MTVKRFTSTLFTGCIAVSFFIAGCSTASKLQVQHPHNDDFNNVEFVKNYDGDTITVNIQGQHPLFGKEIGVRLKGIDTPEIRGKSACEKQLAKKAKDFVSQKLKSAKTIALQNVSRGKYFRIVADVVADGVNLSHLLIAKGYAVSYDGGRKPSSNWCR